MMAEKYGVNHKKPFFPLNSLRILYFMILDFYTQESESVREKMGTLIPKLEAVFSARTHYRGEHPQSTVQDEWKVVEQPLQDVFAVINTPGIHRIFEHYFTYLYPLQDECFLNAYQYISSDQPLSTNLLQLLLRSRAMDSIVFSTTVGELIREHGKTADIKDLQKSLDWHINLVYQMNDLVDAIVFAKDDLEANNFSSFQVIRKIAPEANTAKELIKNTLTTFQEKGKIFPFPTELQKQVSEFYEELVGVVVQ